MNVFCTVASRSHLGYVYALADSLIECDNREPLHVLVVDVDDVATSRAETANVRLHGFREVAAALPATIRHYFDAFELCNALKPFLISLLFREGAERVIYLDADLFCTGSFAPVWQECERVALQVTPHHLGPPALEADWVKESDIADMGFINGGFSAWRRGEASERMLGWLQSRLPIYGFCDRTRGMFVDQKLLPLLLAYHPDDVRVRRDPGLNVAFWNATEREVVRSPDGKWTARGQSVVFFHLSGYRLTHPGQPCSYLPAHTNRRILAASPWLAPLLADYHARLARRTGEAAPAWPFEKFDGVRLTPALRQLLFQTGRLDRTSSAYWRIRTTDLLRATKRRLLASFR